MNRCPFWYESDREGTISSLLSSDGFIFSYGLYDHPLPPMIGRLAREQLLIELRGLGSLMYFRIYNTSLVP